MTTIDIQQLPPPPASRHGWPWTKGAPQLPSTLPDGSAWPRITVVTPSFNQAGYLEETIRSVLLQGYPNLEYFILDGGSTDDSVDIIRKYEPWVDYWTSGPDGGQTAAINKGMQRSTGEILAWLNSDDHYYKSALAIIASTLHDNAGAVAVFGRANWVGSDGRLLGEALSRPYHRDFMLRNSNAVPQSSTFFRRQAFGEAGCLDENLHYAMDRDLWLRLDRIGPLLYIPEVLSGAHVHAEAKTSSGNHNYVREIQTVVERHGGSGFPEGQTSLIESHIKRVFQEYRLGNSSAAIRELEFVLTYLPAWGTVQRLAPAIAQQAWVKSGGVTGSEQQALIFVDWVCSHLPPAVAQPAAIKRQARALVHATLAFSSQMQGNLLSLYRHAVSAMVFDPSQLGNRGLWSALLKTPLNRGRKPVHLPVGFRQHAIDRLVSQYIENTTTASLLETSYAALTVFLLRGVSDLSPNRLSERRHQLQTSQNATTGLFTPTAPTKVVAHTNAISVDEWRATYFSIAALNALGASYVQPLTVLMPYLSPAKLGWWITTLDWQNVYEASEQICVMLFCLIEEGRRTGDIRYRKAAHYLLDWLDARQSSESGGWELGQWHTHSDGLSLFSRLLPIYFTLGRNLPYVERIIDYALFAQQLTGLFAQPDPLSAAADLGAIDVLCKLSLITSYRSEAIKTALTYARTALIAQLNREMGTEMLPEDWQRLLALALIETRFPALRVSNISWQYLSVPAIGWHNSDVIAANTQGLAQ